VTLFVRVRCTDPTKKTMVIVVHDETAAKLCRILNKTSQIKVSTYACMMFFLDRWFEFLIQFTIFLYMSLFNYPIYTSFSHCTYVYCYIVIYVLTKMTNHFISIYIIRYNCKILFYESSVYSTTLYVSISISIWHMWFRRRFDAIDCKNH